MKHISRKLAAAGILTLVCFMVSGCGKNQEPDDKSEKVLQITITPEATPTQAPEEVNPEAVTANGNLTMVNEYLAGGTGE